MTDPQLLDLLTRDVVAAARLMVGSFIRRGPLLARIVETEAYRAEDDPACHAYRSRTLRNDAIFGPPGTAYVFLNYGLHWMLNVAAHPDGRGAAVLIRAAEPLEGLEIMRARRPKALKDEALLAGPGRICQAFAIDRTLEGVQLIGGTDLQIEAAEPSPTLATPRIGITKGVDLPWRFIDPQRKRWVSR